MKKLFTFLLLLLSVSFGNQVSGQDRILERNGNERLVIVTNITPDSVFYRELADSVSQKVYGVNKKQVFMVTYKNGTKEVFTEKATEVPQLSKQDYYYLGQQDARNNFESKGVFWGTCVATIAATPILTPLGGIAAGAVMSLKNPDPKYVKARSPELRKNADYLQGYNKQAKKKKLGSAAGGFGMGVGIVYVAFTLIFSGVL